MFYAYNVLTILADLGIEVDTYEKTLKKLNNLSK